MTAIDYQSKWALSQYYNVKLLFQHHDGSLVWWQGSPDYTGKYIKLMWGKKTVKGLSAERTERTQYVASMLLI